MTEENTLKAMHALVLQHIEARVVDTRPGAVLVVPNTHTVHDLEALVDKHRAAPSRARGTVALHTLDALVAHARRHRTATSAAYVNALGAAPELVVVYDDHPAAADGPAGGWREHRAVYAFPLSEAWCRWTAAAAKPLDVAAFARLLEDGFADVRAVAPGDDVPRLEGVRYATPAELLGLAQGLSVRVEQRVIDQRRLDNGTAQLVFQETHSDERGEPLRVPTGFLLGVPVFVGGPAYAVPVRLRYRVANGQVTWSLALHAADEARREAVREAAARFVAEAGVPVFEGSPENT